jgi:asparagine synthase (glutamine-hydrolysing)
MCGILGALSPAGLELDRLVSCLDHLQHRGPDASAWQLEAQGRIFLGHTRLKVIDVSDVANQPMVSSCSRYVLIYNGEVVNYRDLRKSMRSDYPWRTSSDTETLLALYAQHGKGALSMLTGMFAFAVYDREQKRIFLARDRFGIKPLYYTHVGDAWYFASEISALLPLVPIIQPDLSTIRTYLETGVCDFGPWTFFGDVRALEPGCWMEIDLTTGKVRSGRWYRFEDHIPILSGVSEQQLIEQADELIHTVIRDHLVADVEVGLNVSGGVDSSVLVNVAAKYVADIHVFTQDYEPPYSEAYWVKQVAEGHHLHLVQLSWTDVDKILDHVVGVQGEPFGGVTVCGYHYLYRSAGDQGVTVLLDGNGVDESFLGYKKYHQAYVQHLQDTQESSRAREDYAAFWGEDSPPANPRQQPLTSIDGTLPIRPEAIAPELLATSEIRVIPQPDVFLDPIKKEAVTDLLYAKIPRGLRFNDRISMSVSKELRVPFLDHRLVEFAFGVPTSLLIGRRGTKALFRKVASRLVPEQLASAPKRSVQSPQREWLAREWQQRVTDILESESFRNRRWVDPALARNLYSEYAAGAHANSFFIWQWLNLELWAKNYLDQKPVASTASATPSSLPREQ